MAVHCRGECSRNDIKLKKEKGEKDRMRHKKLIGVIAAIGLAIIAGVVLYLISAAPATPTTSGTWHRTAGDVTLEPTDSGVAYMYWEGVSAGIVEEVEPTLEGFVSSIRRTDIRYRSDETGKLCRTYVPWDADLGPGDHIILVAVYKYLVDMDAGDGLEPTVLVDREVVSFEVIKASTNNQREGCSLDLGVE